MNAKPEFEHLEEYQNRIRKLTELRQLGIEPYPHKYAPTHDSKSLHEKFEGADIGNSETAAAGETESVCVSGRLILFRAMGKNIFAHLLDHPVKFR